VPVDRKTARKWLKEDLPRIAYFLGLKPDHIVVILKPNLRCSYYTGFWLTGVGDNGYHEIHLGLAGIKNRFEFRRTLIHELLHAKGVMHNKKARMLGFRVHRNEDELSGKVYRWIWHKGPKPFELEVLGVET